uniref:RBR-type E3 ubiquitin transferase n=1 Tax=Crassostrea virginica TaxID=6565 RepID=A0A8B8EX29_CRAVI|nr:ATP-dependent RNA helicase DEAH12, chloroplastic-like [Crassostrea virginica]
MADRDYPRRARVNRGKGNRRKEGWKRKDLEGKSPRDSKQLSPENQETREKSERLLTKPGPTFNLIVFQPFKEEKEFLEYLRQKDLPPDIEYEIESFTLTGSKTSIFIHFPSNKAHKDFQSWIRQTRKIGFAVRFQREEKAKATKEFIEKNLQIIEERSTSILKNHQVKMLNTTEELTSICGTQQGKKKSQYIPLQEYERRQLLKKTLEDKSSELNAQKVEFENYEKDIKEQLKRQEGCSVLQNDIDQLLLNYDIECTRLEQALPIYAKRSEIVETVLRNQVCIILGETGSGKSTQLTQYLLQSELSKKGRIVCTQPRKVAAASLAQRVASEMKSTVADVVGYQCGIQKKVSEMTRAVYMTDHTLLNECLKDKFLYDYSCIIIDEAHERSIYTDILLGMIKKCLPRRPELRIIVTSATIDPELFVRYFKDCPVIRVSGRMYPVDIEWNDVSNEEDLEDFERKAVDKTLEIHDRESDGDILLFLTGQLEIERSIERLQWNLKDRSDHLILPLHGKLQTEEQNKIFKETPHGKRKIVISTNVAETSVTIPGIKYVLDTGLAKEMRYDPDKKVNSLKLVKITKSSADQRKGRAGRTSPGKCFRFYSKDDYDKMVTSSVPEILRTHIGHAILKLLQLNVNPMEFDFVESPPENAMETAFKELVMLGAVKDDKITKIGKWIAQLPLDPNLGVFVYNAISKRVGLEAIIIAASCTVSGNLFYRAGSNEQKDTCDKLKIPFCHTKGDHFTFLNVFKKWHIVPEKEKVQWCINNSINGRAMRNIRDIVNEVIFILKKEMNIPLKFELKDGTDNEKELQKLLFKAFQSNLSYFLGHEKAGYHFIDKDQQMVIHPSASFQSLAYYPKWVIIEKVLNTSREYAVNITEVQESDVKDALERKELIFDIEEIQRKRLEPIYKEFVGQQLQRQFVGPRWKHAKEIEKKLHSENKESVFVIDADRDKGEISIYAPEDKDEISHEALKLALDPIREKLQTEKVNIPIFPRCYNVKVSIGPGGEIQDLLCEDDYNSVYIYCSDDEFENNEELIDWLGQFGKIHNFFKRSPANTNQKYRGEVVFETSESAKRAVSKTRDKNSKIQAKPPVLKTDDSDAFKAKLTWCRRKPQSFGFVQIKNADTLNTVLTLSTMTKVSVGGSCVKISRSREKMDELYVQGLNALVSEDILREGVVEAFNISEDDVGKTFIPRQRVGVTTREILETCKTRLERHIGQYVDKKRFRVVLREPYPNDYYFNGYITFNDTDEGYEACSKLHNKIYLNDSVVSFTPEVHSRMYVLDRVFKRIEKKIRAFKENVKKEDRVTIDIKQNQTGNYIIGIDAESVDKMLKTRNTLLEILQGETLDMEAIPSLRHMFTRNGRSKIEEIMVKTHTLIVLNDRNTTISIHGEETDRALAIEEIKSFIENLGSSKLRIIDLKGEYQPSGLMKRIIQMHGIDLQGLKDAANLVSAELDHRKHRIKLLGSEEAIELAIRDVEVITQALLQDTHCKISTSPDCGICLCEVSETELYRLESCGHSYCKDCVNLHLKSAIEMKEFPLRCCYEGCSMLWAWSDINNMKKFGFCSLQNVISASLSCYVAQYPDKARYCITPDCQMVYKVSKEGGDRFVCSLCLTVLCKRCHVNYHTGLSCAMYQKRKQIDENDGLQEWLLRDQLNRDLCPKCYIGIEKHGGCQHMICTKCKSHICWICKAFFDTSPECYNHMHENHGTYM